MNREIIECLEKEREPVHLDKRTIFVFIQFSIRRMNEEIEPSLPFQSKREEKGRNRSLRMNPMKKRKRISYGKKEYRSRKKNGESVELQ